MPASRGHLAFAPAEIFVRKAAGATCASWPTDATIRLYDARIWPSPNRSAVAQTGSASHLNSSRWGAACAAGIDNPDAVAASGYASPFAEVIDVRCELRDDGEAATPGSGLLAVADARALVLPAAVAIPRDILVLRENTGTMQSLRFGTTSAAAVPRAPGGLNNTTGAMRAWQARALAVTAEALFSAGVAAADGAATWTPHPAAASLTLSGRATIVVVLDQRISPFYPAPAAVAAQAADDRDLAAVAPEYACREGNDSAAALAAGTQRPLRLAVYVGGVAAEVLWAAPDGSQVHVATPDYATVCRAQLGAPGVSGASSGTACGHRAVRLVYEPAAGAQPTRQLLERAQGRRANGQRRHLQSQPNASWQWITDWVTGSTNSAATNTTALRALLAAATVPTSVVQCPPWCPSVLPDLALPLAVADATTPAADAWLGTLQPALPQPSLAASQLLVPGALALRNSPGFAILAGLFYAEQCAGYTDFTAGACTNASDPAFSQCAFGSGDGCRLCPAHAMCPGGWRAFPLSAGWYTPSESSGAMLPCAAPAAARCQGWDALAGAVRCGPGYLPGSQGCAACAGGFYQSGDGSCLPCPQSLPAAAALGLLISLGIFIGAALGCFAAILLLALITAKLVGGSVAGARARAADLLLWVVVILQLLAQVGRTAAPGLPAAVSAMLERLSAVQLADNVVPAACVTGYPFAQAVAAMGCAVGLQAALLCVIASGRIGVHARACLNRPHRKSQQTARGRGCRRTAIKALLTACNLLYALVGNTVFELLGCRSVQMGLAAAAALDSDSKSTWQQLLASDDGRMLVQVQVLIARPQYVCYSGAHRAAGAFAWVTLALFVVGYPLWTLYWAKARVASHARVEARSLPRLGGIATRNTSPASSWPALVQSDAAALRLYLHRRGGIIGRLWLCLLGRERVFRRGAGVPPFQTRLQSAAAAHATEPAVAGCSPASELPGPTLVLHPRKAMGKSAGRDVAAAPQSRQPPKPAAAPRRTLVRGHKLKSPGAVAGTHVEANSQAELGFSGIPLSVAPHSVPGLQCADFVDRCAPIARDAALDPFVGSTYRASQLHSRHCNMAAMAALAALQLCWAASGSTAELGGRAAVIVVVLLALAWQIGTRRPYPARDSWKTVVQIGSLLVTCLGTVTTHYALAVALPSTGSEAAANVHALVLQALAYATLSCTVLLLAALALGFARSVYRGAAREEKVAVATAAAAAARQRGISGAGDTALTQNPLAIGGAAPLSDGQPDRMRRAGPAQHPQQQQGAEGLRAYRYARALPLPASRASASPAKGTTTAASCHPPLPHHQRAASQLDGLPPHAQMSSGASAARTVDASDSDTAYPAEGPRQSFSRRNLARGSIVAAPAFAPLPQPPRPGARSGRDAP